MITYIEKFFRQYHGIIIGLFCLAYIGNNYYLLFHSIVEVSGIILGFMIVIMYLNSKKSNFDQGVFEILGISYGFITLFGFLHTIFFNGMSFFPIESSNLSIQLYLTRQFIESFSLLLFVSLYSKKVNIKLFTSIYFIISIVMLIIIFYFKIFPNCFVEGYGVTTFKRGSQLMLNIGMFISAAILIKKRDKFHQDTFKYLLCSIICIILVGSVFIVDMEVSNTLSILGHLLKVLSIYFMYKAVVQVSLITPLTKLRQSQQKYYNLVQLLPEAIFIHTSGKITYCNSAGLELLDVENLKQLEGLSLCDFIDCETTLKNTCIEYSNQDCRDQEFIIVQKGGKKIEVKLSTTPYDEVSTMIIIHDISEQKKAERLKLDLEREEQKLKTTLEYEELKTNFYINISHEFKTPINVILGIAQLLELEKFPEEWNKYIITTKQNCYRLWRLMDNLIDISKINAKSFEVTMNEYDIVQVVEDITLSVADYIQDNSISFTFDTDVEERLITCDPILIERILLNLFSNGIKFSNEQGNIVVNLIDGEDQITIEVQDDGIGIPDDKIDSIFEIFNKVDDSLTRNCEGSGMGLAIVSAFVQMHRGTIEVHSKKGEGSKFVIQLPATKIQQNDISQTCKLPIQKERIAIEFSDIYSLASSL